MLITKIKRALIAMSSWFIKLPFRKEIIPSKMASFSKLKD